MARLEVGGKNFHIQKLSEPFSSRFLEEQGSREIR
jgi:hypothetical protein